MQVVDKKTISLGKPILSPALIPVTHKSTPNCINETFMVNGEPYKVTALSFGSPHGAVVVDDVDNIDVSSIGSLLGTHPLFPKGASIVFIQILDGESLKARLWQYDTGESAYSPEAACVAATAAMMLHKILIDTVRVSMGCNNYIVEWDKCSANVTLTLS